MDIHFLGNFVPFDEFFTQVFKNFAFESEIHS